MVQSREARVELKKKIIVITGASSGIGAALAEKLARDGNTLYLLARRFDLLNNLKQKIESADCSVIPCICDISDNASVTAVFGEIHKHAGSVDLAILNAGIGRSNGARELNLAEAEATLATNLTGALYCINALLPPMLERKSGIIAGVSSMADSRGFPGSGVYSASKAGLSILLESFRAELRGSGVRVITIRPGYVETPMTARNPFMPFLIKAEEAAGRICEGIRKEKRVISFPLRMHALTRLLHHLPARVFEALSAAEYKKRMK